MPAQLSVRVTASCSSDGGVFTVSLMNYASGETVTVTIGGYSATLGQGSGNATLTGIPNGVYDINATGSISGNGVIYVNNERTPSASKDIGIECAPPPAPAPLGCDIIIAGIETTEAPSSEGTGTITVTATGTGIIEYALDNDNWQTSNTFTVAPGNYTVYARIGTSGCITSQTVQVNIAEHLAVTAMPSRDWLPVGLPITYGFTSPDAEPEPLLVNVEVSTNGLDFMGAVSAGMIYLEPINGQYSLNVAPYLQSLFTIAPPVLNGPDLNLFKLYRLAAGKASVYNGTTPPELQTLPQRVLNATILTPLAGNNTIALNISPVLPLFEGYPGLATIAGGNLQLVNNFTIDYDYESQPASRCPKYPVLLFWLNRKGGWETFVFNGLHEYSDEVEDAVLWQDNNHLQHKASLPDVVQKVAVKSGLIPAAYYDVACTIRYSIRVYQYLNGLFREVNIDSGSFPTRKEGDRMKECNFTFSYAEPLIIQQA